MLGSEKAARAWDTLQKAQVSHVLNCGRSPCYFEDTQDGPCYKQLGLRDTSDDIPLMQDTFEEAVDFIKRVVMANGTVLVHCRNGISRSCAVVIAYIMASEHKTLEQAFQEVRGVRQACDPNLGFWLALKEWEEVVNLQGIQPQ